MPIPVASFRCREPIPSAPRRKGRMLKALLRAVPAMVCLAWRAPVALIRMVPVHSRGPTLRVVLARFKAPLLSVPVLCLVRDRSRGLARWSAPARCRAPRR